MKAILFIGLLGLSLYAKSADELSTYKECYVGNNSSLRMRATFIGNKLWAGGFVQYGAKKALISIVRAKHQEETLLEGRPAIVDEEWVEVVDGKINGKYHFTYQGAIFDKIEYINKKGVKFQFKQTEHDYDDCFSNK